MKFIKPSFSIWESQSSLKDIERAARVCYQSQDKISEDDSSAKILVANLIKREHYAMLEFGENIVLNVHRQVLNDLWVFSNEPFFKHFNVTFKDSYSAWLSMNPRTAIEFLKSYVKRTHIISNKLLKLFCSVYTELPRELTFSVASPICLFEENVYTLSEGTVPEFIENDKLIHVFKTVRFICDRGISHELIRMRFDTSMINEDSYAQKSTRYCDEKGAIEYIEPCWIPQYFKNIHDATTFNKFAQGLIYLEILYKELRAYGWKPEQARAILPNTLSTELVVKASLQEWKHIFELRCDKAAHPQMRELMIPLQEEFKKQGYI